METTERQSVGSIIREVLDTMPEGFEASDVAVAVVDRMEPDDYRAYLVDLVVMRVSAEVGYMRGKVTPARKNLSTKQSLIRDQYWPAFLNQRISLPSGYKRLAEATADDLSFLAELRRTQASELMMRAEQFEALASLMRKNRVKYLEQLDPAVGEKTLAA